MDKKYIILILVALAVIGLAAIFIYFNVLEKEPKEIAEQEQEQQQEEEVIPSSEISPEVSRALANRASMRMVDGALFDVGDNYFTIKKATLIGDFTFDLENAEFEYEYKKIKIADESEIVDFSDTKYLTVPNNISGASEILNYLKGKLDDYNVLIYAGYPKEKKEVVDASGNFIIDIATGTPIQKVEEKINHEEDFATYIEWSAWPKN